MSEIQQLIDIKEVAETLGKSVESIRKYKNFGIIRVTDKYGNKDLFDREEILNLKDRLRALRLKGLSLSQIADQLALAREGMNPAETMTWPPAAPSLESSHPLKLLVVDDEEQVRLNLREFFEYHGHRICEAADGEEALTQAFTERPDVILLDLRLPRVDGYQVCQILKGNPITAAIPIIIITALTTTSQKIKGIEIGRAHV